MLEFWYIDRGLLVRTGATILIESGATANYFNDLASLQLNNFNWHGLLPKSPRLCLLLRYSIFGTVSHIKRGSSINTKLKLVGYSAWQCTSRVSNKFFGMRDSPYLRLGIRDFKAKSGRDSGLKVCAGGGMPKVTLGITGLPQILGGDYGIEKPYWVPSTSYLVNSSSYASP